MKPKILLLTKYVWPEGSGAELATCKYIELLSGDFIIDVLSSTKPLLALKSVGKYINNYYYAAYLRNEFKVFDWVNILLTHRDELLRILSKGYDIIYITTRTLYPITLLFKNNLPARIVIHVHDYQPITYTASWYMGVNSRLNNDILYEYFETSDLLRIIYSGYASWINTINLLSICRSDLVITVSNRQREILSEKARCLRNRIITLYNPPLNINIDKKPSRKLVFMGGSSFSKGLHLVLGIVSKLLSSGYKVYLTKIPSGITHYFSKLRRYGLFAMGKLSYKSLLELLSISMATLHPSLYEEPLPYAIIESIETLNIPIASKVGGIPELLKGTFLEKYLFNPWSINDFIRAINYFLETNYWDVFEDLVKIRGFIRDKLFRSSRKITKYLIKVTGLS